MFAYAAYLQIKYTHIVESYGYTVVYPFVTMKNSIILDCNRYNIIYIVKNSQNKMLAVSINEHKNNITVCQTDQDLLHRVLLSETLNR